MAQSQTQSIGNFGIAMRSIFQQNSKKTDLICSQRRLLIGHVRNRYLTMLLVKKCFLRRVPAEKLTVDVFFSQHVWAQSTVHLMLHMQHHQHMISHTAASLGTG